MECPKRIHLIEDESDVKGTPDDPKENETEEVEEIGPFEGLESLFVTFPLQLSTQLLPH